MAQAKLDVLVSVVDQFSSQMGSIGKGLDGLKGKIESMGPAFSKMATIGTASLAAITGLVTLSVQAFGEAERSQRQLEHAIIDVSKGTADQVTQISNLTDALQAKVGIDGDALKMGAAQLSTFGLQSKSVVDLTKSLADFTVNQNGVNASSDQYVQSANTIAKALNGQFGILEKSGVRFTEAQQSLILYGSESEKVAALQEGLAQNLRETTDTLGGVDVATARLSRSFGEVQEALGAAFADSVNHLMDSLVPFIDKVTEWIQKNPELTMTIVEVAAGIAALLAAVGTLGLVLPAIIGGFQALGAVFAFIAANPILLVFAALVAAGILLYQNWEVISAKAVEIWTAISNFFTVTFAALTAFFTNTWNSITSSIIEAWEKVKAFFMGIWDSIVQVFEYALLLIAGSVVLAFEALGIDIVDAWTRVKEFFGTLWEEITGIFSMAVEMVSLAMTTFLTTISTLWSTMWGNMKSVFGGVWDFIKATAGGGLSWIWEKIVEFTAPITEAFGAMWEGVGGAISSAVEGIKNVVKGMLNWMIEKINWVISKLNSVAAAGAKLIPGVSAPQLKTIPALAQGGIVTRPTLAMIGEGGEPEAVIPLSKMGKMGGGITLNLSVSGYFDRRGFEQMIDEVVIQKLRKNLIPS